MPASTDQKAVDHAIEMITKFLDKLEGSLKQKNYVGAMHNLHMVRIYEKSLVNLNG